MTEVCKLCKTEGSEADPLRNHLGDKWHKKCFRKARKLAIKKFRGGL